MTQIQKKLTPADLAAMMCGRICHDIISPVSALGTALEVLNDKNNPDMHEDAMDLVKLSAAQTSAKLQFLRLAFGAGTSAPGMIGLDKLKSLVNGVYGEGKADIHWDTEIEGLDKPYARLVLNIVMLALQSIPRGGRLHIMAEIANGVSLRFKAQGLKARIDENMINSLKGKSPEEGFDGRSIQAFYTGMIVRELKGNVTANIDGETVTFEAVFPSLEVQSAA